MSKAIRSVPLLALLLHCAVAHAEVPYAPKTATGESPRVRIRFGEGATIATRDNRTSLTIRARIQTQALFASKPSENEEERTEFLVRRLRLELKGNLLGETLTYRIQLGFANRDTEADLRLPLRDAIIEWAPHKLMHLRVGQMKVPFGRQRVNSSSALEMVDRSIVTNELNLDRDVGVYLHSTAIGGSGGFLGYALGVFGGDGRNRVGTTPGLLFVAQLNAAPFGRFDDLSEGDLKSDTKPRLLVSVSGAYNQNTNRSQSTLGSTYTLGGFDYAHAAVAALFKWHGFSASGEFLYRRSNEVSHTGVPTGAKAAITEYARSARGYFVQASQMLGPHVQVTARVGEFAPIGETDPKLLRSRELGAGLNYYFMDHNLKLQADYFYLHGSILSEGHHQARLQMQAYF